MGLFQPSERARRKWADKAVPLLGSGTVIRSVFAGRAYARFTTPVAIALGVFIGIFVVALALGVILLPGGVALLLVMNSIRPPRLVVAADQGVALLSRSSFTGRPSKVLAQLSTAEVTASTRSGAGAVPIGPDRVTFGRREREQLHALLSQPVVPTAF